MRVQLAVNAENLVSPFTGIERYTYELMSRLEKFRHLEMHYLYLGTWGSRLRNRPVSGIVSVKKAYAKLVPSPFAVKRFVQQAVFDWGARRYGINLYHEPNFVPYRFAGPTVITIHDLSWLRFPETHPPARVKMLERMVPKAVERATEIIADSDHVRKEIIEQFGVSSTRVHTTYLGVSTEFHPAAVVEASPILKARDLAFGAYLLSVGTLEPRKNIALSLLSYSQLPSAVRKKFPLVIVGMKGWGTTQVIPQADKLLSSGQVRLLGYTSDQELRCLYSGARMLIYPSLYEGFGLPPLEAMACGTPVITSNRASLPEVVGAAGIMIDPVDHLKLRDEVMRLLEDESEARRLTELGIQRARAFTWEECARKTVSVYETALKGNGRVAR